MIPAEYTNIINGLVKLSDYVQIGTNTVIMPSVTIGKESVTGAFTFVTKNINPWKICFGIPAKEIKNRSKKLQNFAKNLSK